MADTDIIKIDLLERIKIKKKILDSKRPFPKSALESLSKELRLQHTFHSNAIEGNTLTLSETKLVLEEGITVGGRSLKDHLEAKNTAKAYDLIEELAKGGGINHETVQKIHEALMKGIIEDAGIYRTKNVRITGAIKIPPDFLKILKLMNELFDEINNTERHPVETSAFLHHKLAEIHPFSDGNGRTARLLNNLYLINHGYPPIFLRIDNRGKYYKYLKSADTGNLVLFANFIAASVEEGLMHYLSIFGGEDELLPLKELAKDVKYSQEYLSLRARQGKLGAVKIGRIWYSTKRVLKEYLKETKS